MRPFAFRGLIDGTEIVFFLRIAGLSVQVLDTVSKLCAESELHDARSVRR